MPRGQFQLFDDLSPDEYGALRADIELRGVLVPVELDEHGALLDGHHRVRICEELGIDYPSVIRAGLTEAGKRAHVRAINLLRRHLSSEQKRRVIADQLRETPEKADREIGRLLGVHHETVGAVRAELIASGEIRQIEQREVTRGGTTYTQRPKTIVAPTTKAAQRTVDLFERGAIDADDLGAALNDVRDVRRQAKENIRESRRQANAALVDEAPELLPAGSLPDRRFRALVLDPPWDWGDEGDVDQFGRGRPTYATMSIEQIAALPIADLAEDDAHLYLWITNRSLPKGFDLLERWGFRYVTLLTWCKPSIGMGNYFRGSTEQVLFGVRGSLPLLRRDVGTHFLAPRAGQHSAKPNEFYALVQECSPGPWIDLFARQPRDGWTLWGAEVA